jgi:hypothetical protein
MGSFALDSQEGLDRARLIRLLQVRRQAKRTPRLPNGRSLISLLPPLVLVQIKNAQVPSRDRKISAKVWLYLSRSRCLPRVWIYVSYRRMLALGHQILHKTEQSNFRLPPPKRPSLKSMGRKGQLAELTDRSRGTTGGGSMPRGCRVAIRNLGGSIWWPDRTSSGYQEAVIG